MEKNDGKFKKIFTPWNKGLTKETDERIKKYSEMHKGFKHSREMRKKIGIMGLGRVPWNKGLTKETNGMIKITAENAIGREVSKKTRKKQSKSRKRFFRSKEGIELLKREQPFRSERMKTHYSTEAGKLNKLNKSIFFSEYGKKFADTKKGKEFHKKLGKYNSKKLKKYFSTVEGKQAIQDCIKKRAPKMREWYKTPEGLKRREEQSKFAVENIQKITKTKYKFLNNKKYIYLRSKLEVAVASYFRNNKIDFVYEGDINVFKLSHGYYINDFYLPDTDIYIQVKGKYVGNFFLYDGIKKFEEAVQLYPNKKFELWDLNKIKELGIDYK